MALEVFFMRLEGVNTSEQDVICCVKVAAWGLVWEVTGSKFAWADAVIWGVRAESIRIICIEHVPCCKLEDC